MTEFTAQAIADILHGTVEGDTQAKVSKFAKIEEGTPGSLTFLANPKYTHHIYNTGATAVLVSENFIPDKPVKATLIKVKDPYDALSRLMTMVAAVLNPQPTGIEEPSFISPDSMVNREGLYMGAFAYVGKGVQTGRNVKIYPHAYIGNGVTIGDDTVIYAGARIYAGCRIGSRCIIHAGAVIGADGFGFAPRPDGTYDKIPQMGNVVIEDDVEIGANTCVDRATMGSTVVGHGTKLDNLIQLAHNTRVGHDTVIASQTGVAGSTSIGSNCMIGGQVGFAGHITVGDNVTIGAQSGIPNNVAPGARLMGYPAVPAAQFARNTAMIRRLGQLFDKVDKLEKKQ